MRKVILQRISQTDHGTFGKIGTDTSRQWESAELPWRDNKPYVSCIPAGTYPCQWTISPKFGYCYHLKDVPKRTDILIHVGNFVGDTDKGFKSNVQGCIVLGMAMEVIDNQKALFWSSQAVRQFEREMNREDFELTILDISKLF